MEEDLDMSWIDEYSRIHSIQQIMNREELDSIEIQTIYMNDNLEISKINKETSYLSANNIRCISKEQLLHIIQSKKHSEKTTYKLFDSLLFTVDLDPRDIQKYVNGKCIEKAKLQCVNLDDDLIIPPSLFIFHSLHTLFLFFVRDEPTTTAIKSILKSSLTGKKTKQTKKVVIVENEGIHKKEGARKTRKIWRSFSH